MKILIATFTFPPHMDGVSEAASATAKAFQEKGWKVEVATEPTIPVRMSLKWQESSIHEFQLGSALKKGQNSDEEIQRYRDLLLEGNYDVIFFHSYSWILNLAVPILDQISAKKVLVSHGYASLIWVPVPKFPFGLAQLTRSAFKSLQMLWWIRNIDRVVFLSRKQDFLAFYDHILARIAGHNGIHIIPNGVDLTERANNPSSFRRHLGIDDYSVLFLCVANYSRRKDQGYAARAFRRAAIPNSVLVFIGSSFNESSTGFQKQDSSRLNQNTTERIIWLENQSREATLNAIACCDVFVLSASHEAQPFVLLEAMRESRPWIARETGCISELPGGLVVRSVAAMAKGMKLLAHDPQMRSKLGKVGRAAAETTFDRKTYVRSYCELIEDLINWPIK